MRHGQPVAHRGEFGAATRARTAARARTLDHQITKTCTEDSSCWRITLAHHDAAVFEAALASHREALVAEWKHDYDTSDGAGASDQRPPLPGSVEAFMRLIEAGWDVEATRRPHGQHTTVVVHLDVAQHTAGLHLGPLLSDLIAHAPSQVKTEMRRAAGAIAEVAGWIAQDVGDHAAAEKLTHTAALHLRTAGPASNAMILMRQSNILTRTNPDLATALATDAADLIDGHDVGRLAASIARQQTEQG